MTGRVTCHRDELFGNEKMKRGKPLKLATQNMVGAHAKVNQSRGVLHDTVQR